jgi:maltose alpha-D-glucosyltransferase / alpha-amylase
MNFVSTNLKPETSADLHWYKDAVIYQLHVKSFFDSNNDGIGDFPGLISKLDYIAELGANTIWLLPFYPSPRRDDGYDISDYRGVHPDYGNTADVRRLVKAAHARGIRIIVELVINHTSDQHPWFQRARRAKRGSPARDFYVWSDDDQKYAGTRIIFVDTERSNWTWDAVAGAYYWHRFYSHQPDLNYDNPQVLKAMLRVIEHWLKLGVDGFRLDAVPYLIEREGTSNENLPETHAIVKALRAAIEAHNPACLLLAEANQWPEYAKDYFGEGDECHMAFNFPLMPRMYMAIGREDRFPITDIVRQTPPIPENCQWAIFLRNHDELTLEMVTDVERDYLWETYAVDRRARLNLGIRRRLAPLLERDRRRIELMNYLLMSMPGTPVIYYGDEIGMGDNIHLGDRDGVRTPMQWSSDRNGGFSRADPAALMLPTIMDALYGYSTINVEAETRDPHSLLNWMRRILAVRRKHQAFGRGKLHFLYPKNRKILAYLREYEEETILCVANLSRSPQAVELDLSEFADRIPIELNNGSLFPPVGQLPYLLTLPPYGFYWFILALESEAPSWHVPAPAPMPEYETIVLRGDLAETLLESARTLLECEILPPYLAKRRWFAAKGEALQSSRLANLVRLPGARRDLFLSEIETQTGAGTARWALPLTTLHPSEATAALPNQLALARVRQGRTVRLLTDGFAVADFARAMASALVAGARLESPEGEIQFLPIPDRIDALRACEEADVNWLAAEQSNSSLTIGDVAILKIFRRVTGGEHPEAEMGRYLTRQGFAYVPPLLGEVVRVANDGTPHTLAVAEGFVRNQGDAWTWLREKLLGTVGDLASSDLGEAEADHVSDYKDLIVNIGHRLGELHRTLSRETEDTSFAPVKASPDDTAQWLEGAISRLDTAFASLARPSLFERPEDQTIASSLLRKRAAILRSLRHLVQAGEGSLMTRIHGDFHLGQVLVVNGDAYLIDFEGEPARSLKERLAKSSPLRDVAGVLRSFEYVAATIERRFATVAAAPADGRHEAFIARFRESAPRLFLDAYRKAASVRGKEWNKRLLNFFLIEKAAYEIGYEAANRPAWLPIPLAGLAALVDRGTGGR